MAELAQCADDEDIVKGVLVPDIQNGELRPALLAGKESSYSRLAIYPIAKILWIFRRDLPQPPERLLVGYLVFNVARMKAVANDFRPKQKKEGYKISVIPIPIRGLFGNLAHAETRPKIPDPLTRELLKKAVKERQYFPPRPSKRDYLLRTLIWVSRRYRRIFLQAVHQ